MKRYLLTIFLFTLTLNLIAQDSVLYRVILIGDAGEIDMQQKNVVSDAVAKILTSRTSVFFLGDNIYPRGMGLPGSAEEKTTQEILKSQYEPLRKAGAPVYFLPGNHDWDRMGPAGLAKIKQQSRFLEMQNDSLLRMIPREGCPDPVEIPLSDSLTVIAFDSEWWVYTYNKTNQDGDCDCSTKDEIIMRLEELFFKNRHKVILLASHHPFQTYGTHGGYFSLKDHLFPLTAASKNLYIPLPVIGSLYPFLRNTFTNPEDVKHPLYQDMIRRIDGVFDKYPNLIHVAGHEHGLQLIKGEQFQVVSGAGAKNSYAKKGKHSLFADATQGYVIADILKDNAIQLTYYIYSDTGVSKAFSYKKPYVRVRDAEQAFYESFTGDSTTVAIRPDYEKASNWHRKLFGENYRKEWATETKLPLIRISEISGGLRPTKRGGGMQSKSLRLEDKNGKEWVIRSVEKSPDLLLPEALRETFARDWLDDAVSAQHPYSALVVPPLAHAANVPHTNPVIGVIAPDKNLGVYEKAFVNTVCLLEEREPLGESDNTFKVLDKIRKDNDNSYDSEAFLRARLLDLLIGDWDRHEDQWRWVDSKKGNEEVYLGVPRDRDQVFRVSDGLFPTVARRRWIAPTLQGFGREIDDVRYSLFKTRFVNHIPASHISYERWTEITENFVNAITDSVLEAALRRLPPETYTLRHNRLLTQLKDRRKAIPAAMDEYYRFINKIVDIRASDKNENAVLSDTPEGVRLTLRKKNKDGAITDTLMSKVYPSAITKEIRLYTGKGEDDVTVDVKESPVKIRLIGDSGAKTYEITDAGKKIRIYGKEEQVRISGNSARVIKRLDNDSTNTAFVPVNLYNVTVPLMNAGINIDDGFLLGAGFRHIRQEGFRKTPYANTQQIMLTHSFSTEAFALSYRGEWNRALGSASFVMSALINAPDNTRNFFGRGNSTPFIKTGDFKRYYRSRYNTYLLDAALQWRNDKGSSLSIGPSFQYYTSDPSDNVGRIISNSSLINSYDSLTVSKEKAHAGFVINFNSDKRNNAILPSWGTYVNIRIQGYKGLNDYSRSFLQVLPELAFYKSLNKKSTVVIAERLGGGISAGKTAFYQSLFLGGHDNLLGYRQYRFAGQHMVYNNLELRIKASDFASYILPGQFGFMAFYDIGRVWEKGERSSTWHNGTGAGVYFAPAQITLFRLLAGYSKEGWYPYAAMKFRF
ncbi:calcineurin-like phosphoesterase family protein [Arcticibacter tournemirensis]|uniref:BamA/TamA family outer membrane protein n=1 Tax=Arcticibacter tournemirensis TaxID=699437 RepID=A0A5M9HAP8_9SPHI|nr:BamA/TamA family outer membrane protein [Arcticibacter tournemirensis]KAA8483409.1 BamA/TamA family outer membrane protein [Arcticibacter tournemirensis]TQM50897.1 calcineurin-like phosphoesterase family protein [Arcticibacter tournemirensis]